MATVEDDHKEAELKRPRKAGRDGGIIGRRRGRDGRKLWRSHCVQLMNSGIQMVVGGGQAQ